MSCFLSRLYIFLIVILLDDPQTPFTPFSSWMRAGRDTYFVLFQLKRFFIYSDQSLQKTLYVMLLPQNLYWKLLLSGFRSVLVNATDELLRLKIRFVARDLVPSGRVTCTIASRMNFFDTKKQIYTFVMRPLMMHERIIPPGCRTNSHFFHSTSHINIINTTL